jgi:hypothetical protein
MWARAAKTKAARRVRKHRTLPARFHARLVYGAHRRHIVSVATTNYGPGRDADYCVSREVTPSKKFCARIGLSYSLLRTKVSELSLTQQDYVLLARMMYILELNGRYQPFRLPKPPRLKRAICTIADLMVRDFSHLSFTTRMGRRTVPNIGSF